MSKVVPYIPTTKTLPEITVKGIILGILLSIILGAANTYLGLRVGLTVSASIPAAVVSMGVLRLFRNRNILENNAVQTAASAGESLAAGVLFTVPALLILDHWTQIEYLETTIIALTGGVLGVLFTVPLRRALIVEAGLRFPEGVATSEVLKAGDAGASQGAHHRKAGGTGLFALIIGAAAGAGYKFLQSGFNMWSGAALYGARARDSVIAFGADLSPALLAVGYIVGLQIASLVFMGGVLGWLIGIPLYSAFAADAGTFTTGVGAVDAAGAIWSARIRYIGVGAMLVGGLWSLLKLRTALGSALKQGFKADQRDGDVPRVEQELSGRATFTGVALLTLPLTGVYWFATGDAAVAGLLAGLMLITGFLFSAIGAYMAGLVGSSNNPISGVTILSVLSASLLLLALGIDAETGPAAAIFVAAVIASAGAIASDNMQDLKAGHLLGATPRRQQIMQIVGVTAGALTVALVLQVLTSAYELGSPDLAAPQAGLMAAVAGGVFGIGELPGDMIAIGAVVAVILIILDEILTARGSAFRTPVMPVAVGIYLPVGLSAPIFVGGLIAWSTSRWYDRQSSGKRPARGRMKEAGLRMGTLAASGLIAGEALIGILVAALVATERDGRPLIESIAVSDGTLQWAGALMMGYLIVLLAYLARRPGLMVRA